MKIKTTGYSVIKHKHCTNRAIASVNKLQCLLTPRHGSFCPIVTSIGLSLNGILGRQVIVAFHVLSEHMCGMMCLLQEMVTRKHIFDGVITVRTKQHFTKYQRTSPRFGPLRDDSALILNIRILRCVPQIASAI